MRLKVPFFSYVLALIGLLLPSVIFAAILPSLINAEPVKARLLAELNEWAGAEVKIEGPVSIESFFSLSVNLNDVEIAGFKALPNIKAIRAERIMARIAWTDLLAGNLDFDKIKIYNARANAVSIEAAALPDAVKALLASPLANPFDAFSLTNCRVTFVDAVEPSRRELLITSLAASLRKSSGRIDASGVFAWNGERVRIQMMTRALAPGSSETSVPVTLDLSSRLLSGNFSGQTQLSTPWGLSGHVSTSMPDAAELTAWLGAGIATSLHQPVAIAGQLDITGDTGRLDSAALSIGDEKVSGNLSLLPGDNGQRRLEGSLAFDQLNVGPIWHVGFAGPGSAASGASAMDMDLGISARSVRWDTLASGAAAFTLTRKAGLISVEIAELGLFGGSMLGQVDLDFSRPRAIARARLTAENVEAAELLQALSQRDWLAGRADVNIEAEAEGDGLDQLVASATGRARLDFPEGGQIRLDIPELVRTTSSEGVDGWRSTDFARTDFDELRLQLSLQGGQIQGTDLTLASPGAMVRGKGEVDILRQLLDWQFTVRPNPGEDTAGAAETGGGEDSLSIKGPWTRPAIRSSERSGRAGGVDVTPWQRAKRLLAGRPSITAQH